MMRKKFDNYQRFCKRCGKVFEAEAKFRRICDNCKIVRVIRKTPKTLNNTDNLK